MSNEKKLFIVSGIAYGGVASYFTPGGTPVHFDINLFAVSSSSEEAVESAFADQMALFKEYKEAAGFIRAAESEKAAADWLKDNPEKESVLRCPPAEPVQKENWRAKEVKVPGYEIQLIKS